MSKTVPESIAQLPAIICGVLLFSTICSCAIARAQEHTYEVTSSRKMEARGNWDEIPSAEKPLISRLETTNSRWALEVIRLRGVSEGSAVAQLLNPSQEVVWADTIGDAVLMSPSVPAFAAFSTLSPRNVRIYNFDVSTAPVYENAALHVDRIAVSRDGGVFGLFGAGLVTLVSVEGEEIAKLTPPQSGRPVCVAISDGGALVAIGTWGRAQSARMYGGTRPQGKGLSENRSARADALSGLYGQSDASKFPGNASLIKDSAENKRQGIRRESISPAAMDAVTVIDLQGTVVGEFVLPPNWSLPQRLAFSEGTTPVIGVATYVGVSLWTYDGKLLWQDSAAFTANVRELPKAVGVSDRSLFVVTSRQGQSLFWAWDHQGTPEVSMLLPPPFDAHRSGASLSVLSDSLISVSTEHEILNIRRSTRHR